MRLTPTEMDRLTIFTAAELARRRRAKGWKLTHPEALAIICDEMHEAARGGATYDEVTTLITGGLNDNPAFNLRRMFEAFEYSPVNLGILGRAASTVPDPLLRQIESGACGLKVHEDYAGYPSVIDQALTVADAHDIQIAMHTDGINESCELHETVAAIGGRAIHAYHVEGIGGGHAPDILAIAGVDNVIGSSTTPTIPYGRNVVAEHHAMMWSVHGMNPRVPSDRLMIADRIRDATMPAESRLPELDAISIINSDSQGMGRIGESIRRTWQLAHQMKAVRGGDPPHDNPRIFKHLAKYTLNPARAHGIDRWVGSLEPGKIADIVLWRPEFFGVKPELVIKGGFVAWGALGEGNASIPQSQPVLYGPHWGGQGVAAASLSANFVSAAAVAGEFRRHVRSRRRALAVTGTREVGKRHMLYNQANPRIEIDPRTVEIRIDGATLPPLPDDDLPLNRRYFLL